MTTGPNARGGSRVGPVAAGIVARQNGPGNGQGALLDPADVDRPVRRVEGAVQGAVESAGHLADVDRGMAALAVELGRAIDTASRRLDPYGVAAAARELRETLVRLQLDPVSRADAADGQLADLLADLGRPT